MKKINFKVFLVIVLALALVLSFAACDKGEESPSPSPSTDPPVDIATPLGEVLAGLDQRINGLGDLTDRFEADVEFYATVNEVEYLVNFEANVDISDEATAVNSDNNLALEITKAEDLVFGFYYNGEEDAFLLDVPGENIKRYIDGFNLLNTVKDLDRGEGGSFASYLDNDISLYDLAADMLGLASIAFSGVEETKTGTVTHYDFTFNAGLTSMLPTLFDMLADYEEDINSIVDKIFGVEGFKMTEFTIPEFDLHVLADVDDNQGLTNFGIDLNVPAFTFYLNDADREAEENGTQVAAFDLQAGINLILNPATTYSIDPEVPSTEDTGYEFFSPFNVNTSGLFELKGSEFDNGFARFVVQTDINPFKLTEAEGFVLIETSTDNVAWETQLEMNIVDGSVYVMYIDDDEETLETVEYAKEFFEIQDGIDFVTDIIEGLKNLELPSMDDLAGDTEVPAIDTAAIIDLVTTIPNLVVDGTLTIDKAFLQQAIDAFGIEDADLPEDIEITAWLVYDTTDTDKIVGARGEVYIKLVDYELFEDGFTGTKYAPATFESDYSGKYKLDGTTYVLMTDEEWASYTGETYAPVTFTESTTGLYKQLVKENTYYAEFSMAVENVYSLELGKVTGTPAVDEKAYDAIFTIVPQEGFEDGFTFVVTDYTEEVDDVLVDLTLSDFTFEWSYALEAADFNEGYGVPTDSAEYVDLLPNPADQAGLVLEGIQEMIYYFGGAVEIELDLNYDYEYDTIYHFAGADLTIPDPVREGYTFSGWYTDAECTTAYTVPATMPSEDITIYAKWVATVG